jgi:predicted helicase
MRDNEWYKIKNVLKLGITTSIKDRNNSYITGEIERGKFIKILELDVNQKQLLIIDKLLKIKFKNLNIYLNGGTEFYDRIIENKLEDFLIKSKIKFKLINEDEVKRINRKSKVITNNYEKLFKNLIEQSKIIKPKDYQQEVLNKITDYYYKNNIGKLIWSCGIGKSIMSILIVKHLNFNKIIIGVSSCYLQQQFEEEIRRIYNKIPILIIGINTIEEIKEIYKKEKELFIITTYHSCYLFNNSEFNFDFKIADECHHLVNIDKENNKRFVEFHKIKANKTLFMTATPKIMNNSIGYSMDNEEIFGKMIDEKTVKWAIDNKKITDYKLILIKNSIEELVEIKNKLDGNLKNKELFISTYMALKSLTIFPTHILIYTNSIDDANLVNSYIEEIMNYGIIDINKDELYHNSLHSGLKSLVIKENITKFEKSKYGIISCIQIFSEGVNCPILDGICIACNMISEISIIQKLLRPNRLNKENPNKIAYYILPYIGETGFTNIRHIINQLSLIDSNIEQKLIVSNINNYSKYSKEKKLDKFEIINNKELLLKLKLKLRHNKDIRCDLTEEQNEYNYVQNINKSLNLNSRKEYLNSKEIHENYIENPESYFIKKGVWINWCDFLNYDTSKFIKTKENWIKFCKEKNINSIESYNETTKIYEELPIDPEDYYREFTNIENELELNIKKRRK